MRSNGVVVLTQLLNPSTPQLLNFLAPGAPSPSASVAGNSEARRSRAVKKNASSGALRCPVELPRCRQRRIGATLPGVFLDGSDRRAESGVDRRRRRRCERGIPLAAPEPEGGGRCDRRQPYGTGRRPGQEFRSSVTNQWNSAQCVQGPRPGVVSAVAPDARSGSSTSGHGPYDS